MPNSIKEHNRIRVPSFLIDSIMPIYFLVFVVFIPLFFAYYDIILGKTTSPYFYVAWPIIFTTIWVIVYFILKRYAYSVSIRSESIKVQGPKQSNVYLLNTIEEFYLKIIQGSSASIILMRMELGFKDNDEKNVCIYQTDWGGLIKRWKKFGTNISEITKKKFTFSYFLEGTDGKLYTKKEYWSKWPKTVL